MASVHRPNSPCQNPHCGNTLFVADYAYQGEGAERKFVEVWQCTNCSWHQPRQIRNRRTNKRRAYDLYTVIRKEWEETDKALDALTAQDNPNRIPNGCQLVHSSLFNHHLTQLQTKDKLSNWDIKYHAREARLELERAKAFVQEKLSAGTKSTTN